MGKSNLKNIIGVLIAILVGVGVALAGGQESIKVLELPLFWFAIAAAYVIQWIVFIISFIQ